MRSIILDLDLLFTADADPFWHDTRRLRGIFSRILDAGLGITINWYRPGDDYLEVPDLDKLLRRSDRWASGGHTFASTPVQLPASKIDLTLLPQDLRLMVILSADHVASRPDAYERLIDLAVKLQADVARGAVLTRGAIRATGIDWQRPVPPRTGDGWSLGVPAMLISRSYYSRPAARRPQDLQKLLDATLPPNARREDRGDIVVLKFARSLDEAEVTAAAATHDAWLSNVLDLPLA